jgi:CBS domain-containing protein
MVSCPYCGSDNIEGVDDCADCGQSLDDMHLAPPQSDLERSLLGDRVSSLKPKHPVTADASTPVGEVMRLMVQRKIGCVVVVDLDQPIGIFSERDALRKIDPESPEAAARPVSEFMTPHPQTLVADAKIAFAVQRMDLGGYRHLPVVGEQGNLVGIISARDILRHLTDNMAT